MLKIIDHPLIADKLATLRASETLPIDFRRLVTEIAALMVFPVLADIPTLPVDVKTPLGITTSVHKIGAQIILVPILRAGLAMENGFNSVIPTARTTYIGIMRNETNNGVSCYYNQVNKINPTDVVVVLDPMLATGASAALAIETLIRAGARIIKFVSLIAVREGIDFLQGKFPELTIYTAKQDEGLNQDNYILPGLGDAGDRLYDGSIIITKK